MQIPEPYSDKGLAANFPIAFFEKLEQALLKPEGNGTTSPMATDNFFRVRLDQMIALTSHFKPSDEFCRADYVTPERRNGDLQVINGFSRFDILVS